MVVMTTISAFDDVDAFTALAEPFLIAHEAENNVLFGTIGNLRRHGPSVDRGSVYLGIGRDGQAVTGAVIWTEGWRAVLSFPEDLAFAAAAGLAIHEANPAIDGVLGPPRAAEAFADSWRSAGTAVERGMAQLAYQLSTVPGPPGVPGLLREARPSDRELLIAWMVAFAGDADLAPISVEHAAQMVDRRLAREGASAHVWDLDPAGFDGLLHPTNPERHRHQRRLHAAGAARPRLRDGVRRGAQSTPDGAGTALLLPVHGREQPDLEPDLPAHRLRAGGRSGGVAVRSTLSQDAVSKSRRA